MSGNKCALKLFRIILDKNLHFFCSGEKALEIGFATYVHCKQS